MARSLVYSLPFLLAVSMLSACYQSVVATDATPRAVAIDCSNYYDEPAGYPLQVIRTQREYEALQHRLLSVREACADSTFPEIDFSRYTLLGATTEASGCTLRVPVSRMSIHRDRSRQRVVWKITNLHNGVCMQMHAVTSWVVVPTIPVDYTVSVAVETRWDTSPGE